MSKAEKAVSWAVGIANDDSHGYDQRNRWGTDYDCSSLIISAWREAGIPLQSTYTGNMRQDMLSHGFHIVTDGSLQAGDVLLNERSHTAMMISGTMLVQASINEHGTVTGGQPGDQTGREIAVKPYYSYPWDCVLRYEEDSGENAGGEYIVQAGDTLWGIAEKLLGDGMRYTDIMKWNGLTGTAIYTGERLAMEENNDHQTADTGRGADGAVSGTERVHKVTMGETLWSIAEKYLGDGTRYDELAKANGIASENINNIYVGQELKIP